MYICGYKKTQVWCQPIFFFPAQVWSFPLTACHPWSTSCHHQISLSSWLCSSSKCGSNFIRRASATPSTHSVTTAPLTLGQMWHRKPASHPPFLLRHTVRKTVLVVFNISGFVSKEDSLPKELAGLQNRSSARQETALRRGRNWTIFGQTVSFSQHPVG